jgi:hypothetical protein
MSNHPLKCNVCYKPLRDRAAARKHYEQEHGPSGIKHCNNCGVNYPSDAYHRC